MTHAELVAKYPRGCRVRATPRFHEQFRLRPGRADTGVVVGYGRRGDLVRVRRDGLRRDYTFHVNFWEPVAAAGVA